MGATPAEPAAALPVVRPVRPVARGLAARVRFAMLALAGALLVLAVLLVAYELAAARVPQHRAALEELIRHQTGLEVRFSRLAVRWGWSGPEALFQEVELGEPRGAGPLLRARTLAVGLDAWRLVRNGQLEAHHITLENPVIDLAGPGRRPLPAVTQVADARGAGARLLAHWRGGRINVVAGTLRTVLPGITEPVTLGISRAQLQRLGADWTGEAQLVLPQTLGASVQVSLQMRSPADLGAFTTASIHLAGQRLELARWLQVAGAASPIDVPRSGRGDFEVQAAFVHGQLRAASGHMTAESLEWGARAPAGPSLAFASLRGNWRLARRGRNWLLRVDALELATAGSEGPPSSATAAIEFSPEGDEIRGRASRAPLAALLPVARWYVAQVHAGGASLAGEAREVAFDWAAQRAPGDRLRASAELVGLEIADEPAQARLVGLSGRAVAREGSLELELSAPAAQLVVQGEPAVADLEVGTHLTVTAGPSHRWQLEVQELRAHGRGLGLSASGSVGWRGGGAPAVIDAHLLLKDVDVALCARLLAPQIQEDWAEAAGMPRSGRVESAELTWRGPLTGLPWNVAGTRFTGSMALHDASLRESDTWPGASDVSAKVDWHGARFHAAIARARTSGFLLTGGLADWDARAPRSVHFAGHLAGNADQLIAWLQSHPQAAAWTPGLQSLDLHGSTVLELELGPGSRRMRVAAALDGAQLRPVPGLPPLQALRGTLSFAEGHLLRSSLTAHWLGGPVGLSVAEHREHGVSELLISARGVMDVKTAMQAAAINVQQARLSGSADWSALLTVAQGAGTGRWHLHADSSLAGVASALPEPFAKTGGTALPLHLDWESANDGAELRIALGERLAAAAALVRSGGNWRIERGAVRLGGATPAVPVEPIMALDGTVSRLDLAACLALWRLASADAALPALRARLKASELVSGKRGFGDTRLLAEATGGAGSLRLESSAFSASASWPAAADAAHPALLHLSQFGLGEAADPIAAAQLAAALEPAAEVTVDEIRWRGRPLGSFSATLALRGGTLEANDISISGAATRMRGNARCTETGCTLGFDLDSDDAAATLSAFGYAPELSAREGHIEGQLHWQPQAARPLATLGGSLHMHFEDGIVSPAVPGAGGSFVLLSVPALLAGMAPEDPAAAQPALRFARLSAEYQLSDGEAVTPGVHVDGDAEILMRGRVALESGNYDEHAWILRGEDRLPAAVRHFAPRPGVAAMWLSLRELLGADSAVPAPAALRLRGPSSDPIVTGME